MPITATGGASPLANTRARTSETKSVSAASDTKGTAAAFGRDVASTATTSSAAPAARDMTNFSDYLQDQGRTNGCGTTSLAMLLSFWKGKAGAYTREGIDKTLRPANGPTPPNAIEGYVRSQGFDVTTHNHGSLEDLAKNLDAGLPTLLLINSDPSRVAYYHYVVAVGYTRDASGKVDSVTIANPAGGQIQTRSAADLDKSWADLSVWGHSTGMDRLMFTIKPKGDVSVKGQDGKTRSSNDLNLPSDTGVGWKAGIVSDVMRVGYWFKKLF